jgi:flagellar assembly factor FliW
MTGNSPAVIGQSMLGSGASDKEEIDSRFGKITIYPRNPILFPTGLLGLPDKVHFCLSHLPSEKMSRFKLLQSLDDRSLSFLTLPIDITNPIIDRVDIEQAANDLEMPIDEVATLLVVTVHRESGIAKLSVNARAPVFMHAARRVAAQYVFPHAKYQIRQPLSL